MTAPDPGGGSRAGETGSSRRTAGRPRSRAVSDEALTSAVIDLVCAHGFNGWSMRDLASYLGVSLGTVTHHARDKQTLLVEALDAAYVLPPDWDRYRRLSPTAQLERMIEHFMVDSPRRHRAWRFFVEYVAAAGYHATLRQRHEERYERQRRFYARLIAGGVAADEFATDLDPELEAARLLALAHGLAIQQVVTPEHLSARDARQILESHLRGLLAR